VILSEIGVDVSKFPTEKHFANWLGLCPQTSRSNKTEKRRRARKGSGRLKQAFRMCAQAVGRSYSPLGTFYRRIRSRIGGRGACTATAHKLARLVYRMLKYGKEYVAKGMAEYEAKLKEQAERALKRKGKGVGLRVGAEVGGSRDRVVSRPSETRQPKSAWGQGNNAPRGEKERYGMTDCKPIEKQFTARVHREVEVVGQEQAGVLVEEELAVCRPCGGRCRRGEGVGATGRGPRGQHR